MGFEDKKESKELSEKQKKFCELYASSLNAYQSALGAGYSEKTAKINSHKWLEKIRLKEYIASLTSKEVNSRMADINDINTFWSDLIFDTNADMKDRLKASELRGKVLGAFTENIKITSTKDIEETHKKLEDALFSE